MTTYSINGNEITFSQICFLRCLAEERCREAVKNAGRALFRAHGDCAEDFPDDHFAFLMLSRKDYQETIDEQFAAWSKAVAIADAADVNQDGSLAQPFHRRARKDFDLDVADAARQFAFDQYGKGETLTAKQKALMD